MYTATLTQIDKASQKAIVTFTNGSDTQTIAYDLGSDIQAQVTSKLTQLNLSEAAPLTVGIITPTPPVTPPAPPAPPAPYIPTQAEIDFNNFQKWMQLTIALNAAKQLGWITGNEPMVIDIKAKVLGLAAVNLPKLFS